MPTRPSTGPLAWHPRQRRSPYVWTNPPAAFIRPEKPCVKPALGGGHLRQGEQELTRPLAAFGFRHRSFFRHWDLDIGYSPRRVPCSHAAPAGAGEARAEAHAAPAGAAGKIGRALNHGFRFAPPVATLLMPLRGKYARTPVWAAGCDLHPWPPTTLRIPPGFTAGVACSHAAPCDLLNTTRLRGRG
jgi:hypothetical protein